MKKILLCGFGSIGQKHAENLKSLGADMHVWRARADQKDEIESAGYIFESDLDNGIEWADGVVIATSTDQHMDIVLKAAAACKGMYIEKPLSHSKAGVQELLDQSDNLVIEVGCQLRQHPNLKALKKELAGQKILAFNLWVGQNLSQWRSTDYRESYSADATRGGGALFDLVHEVDLVHWLISPVKNVMASLSSNSDLEMQAEDLANLILETEGGATGTVQLDMLSPAYRRGGQIVCADAVYKWDFKAGELYCDDGANENCIDKVPDDFQTATLLRDHMSHFLSRLGDPSILAQCSLVEAAHDLDILLAARKSHKEGARQAI